MFPKNSGAALNIGETVLLKDEDPDREIILAILGGEGLVAKPAAVTALVGISFLLETGVTEEELVAVVMIYVPPEVFVGVEELIFVMGPLGAAPGTTGVGKRTKASRETKQTKKIDLVITSQHTPQNHHNTKMLPTMQTEIKLNIK